MVIPRPGSYRNRPDPGPERERSQRGLGPWEKRILDLADGNSPGQVTEILYRDEVAKGAHLADIGIWKNLFDRSVADDIGRLVSEGYLSVSRDGKR